jgi:hypothetical protein
MIIHQKSVAINDMSTQIPNIESLYDDCNSQEILIYQAKASSSIFAPQSNIGETMPGSNHVPIPGYNNHSQHARRWRNRIEIYLIEG